MRFLDCFNGITRRGLRINYVSPFICELGADQSGSGSSSGVLAALDILPVNRLPGPASVSFSAGVLSWTGQSYIYSYTIYYSSSSEGPFQLLTSNVLELQFDVTGLAAGSYFFKITGTEPDAGETLPSPTIGPETVS